MKNVIKKAARLIPRCFFSAKDIRYAFDCRFFIFVEDFGINLCGF